MFEFLCWFIKILAVLVREIDFFRKTTSMGACDEKKSCVKCQKAIKSTEKFLLCGLWCRKSFHNDCVGLSNTETRVIAYSKERIKFHCETCENRLGVEVVGEKETHEPNKLQNCVNLLELVQKILKLSNELSNDNSVINKKLDTVISSNTRLEKYILQSPNCIEKRIEETRPIDDRVECVESFSERRTIGISEENDTNSANPTVNSESVGQQSDDNSSALHIAGDVTKHLFDNQEAHGAEECSSNECAPSENLLADNDFTIEKTEIEEEECPSSEDFVDCDTISIGNMEHDVDEATVREDIVQEIKQEVESASSDIESESTFVVSREDRTYDHTYALLTEVSHSSGKSHMFQCTTEQEMSCGNKSGTSCAEHRCEVWKKILTKLQQLKEQKSMSRCELRRCCKVCHKTFACDISYQNHIQLHTRKHKKSCDICNKTFKTIHALKEHLLLHTGDRPYRCNVCSQTFRQISNLTRHKLVHSSERRYRCSVCSKTYKMKSTLKQHMLLHSVERPYSCNVCSKTFTQRSSLYVHLRVHSR